MTRVYGYGKLDVEKGNDGFYVFMNKHRRCWDFFFKTKVELDEWFNEWKTR